MKLWRTLWVTQSFPVSSNGFIDESDVFKLVVGSLKCPLEYLDKLTPLELSWLVESRTDADKRHYEMIAYSVQVGVLRTQTKKKIVMFEDTKPKVNKISKEDKASEMKKLKEVFNTSI